MLSVLLSSTGLRVADYYLDWQSTLFRCWDAVVWNEYCSMHRSGFDQCLSGD